MIFNTNTPQNPSPFGNPNPLAATFNPNPSPSFGANPNQQMFATNPNTNPSYGNPLVGSPNPQNPQNQEQALLQFQTAQILQIMGFIYRRLTYEKSHRPTNQTDLQIALNQLSNAQKSTLTQIKSCLTPQSGITEFDQPYLKQVKQHCLRLKSNNETILAQMFNLKERVARLSAISLNRNVQYQEEYQVVQEKIRRVKLEIAGKLNLVRNRRMLGESVAEGRGMGEGGRGTGGRGGVVRVASTQIVMTQLKDVTEVLNRELIRQREEINVLVKQLYQ